MVTISIHKSKGADLGGFDFSELFYADRYARSSSVFGAYFSGLDALYEFRGKGFKYNENGEPYKGTVTTIGITVDGVRWLQMDGISASVAKFVDVATSFSTKDDKALIKSILSGDDRFNGGGKTDVIFGHNGNDKITGNGGGDRLYGGAGADTFIFKKVGDSTAYASGRDKLYDFSQSHKDKIDLKAIDANSKSAGNQTFKFIGDDDFHKKAGELRYEKKSGDTVVYGDVNGDGKADFSIALEYTLNLKSSDFLL